MYQPAYRVERVRVSAVGVLLLAGCATAPPPPAMPAAETNPAAGVYYAWVTSESADEVSLVRFADGVATVERSLAVGVMPVEIDGPHGVAPAPDGRHIYVSLGHGAPNGSLLKVDVATDEVVAHAPLGRFPATVSVTPDGEFGFVSNFNLHGDHVPSSVSKVHLPSMRETARIETCVMPHGSRVDPQGKRHYSVCMMDELLVEIDVEGGTVSREFSVRPGMEGAVEAHTGHDVGGGAGAAGAAAAQAAERVCSPTWAEPSADGSSVFVTCNRAGEVLEIDVEGWSVRRRFATGEAPYNLGVTPDGRYLLVSLRNRTATAVEVHDLATGERVASIPTSTVLAHGIAVTPDSRYAFVSVEGVGSEPGKVDVIDLGAFRRVASAAVGPQATGIAVAP